jgi:toxin secretion/phage lysis holin
MISRDPTKLNYEVLSVENIKTILANLTDYWALKALAALALSINDWFFHPRHDNLTIVCVFVLFDTITGFMKAHKNHVISSSGFFRFSVKIMVYFILMAVGSLLDKIMPVSEYVSALSIMTGFLAVTESLSVLENISALGYSVPTKVVSTLRLTKKQFEDPTSSAKEEVNNTKS